MLVLEQETWYTKPKQKAKQTAKTESETDSHTESETDSHTESETDSHTAGDHNAKIQGVKMRMNITKTRLFKYIKNFTTKKWKL